MSASPRGAAIPFAVCCLGVALFSVMDAAMKGLGLAIGLYNALFWRAVAGTLLGLALMLATRQRWPARAVLRIHLLRGVVVAFMAALFFWAILRLPLADHARFVTYMPQSLPQRVALTVLETVVSALRASPVDGAIGSVQAILVRAMEVI